MSLPLLFPNHDYRDALSFSSQAALNAQATLDGSFSAMGRFVVGGLVVTPSIDSNLFYVGKYVGEKSLRGEIRRQRRYTAELLKRMGQPVIVKHQWNPEDVAAGLAIESSNFQSAYGQVRNRDPLSYGVGFRSVETSPNEWVAPNGEIITADTSPGPNFSPAPMYRGYGPGYVTYIIEPDTRQELWKHQPSGIFQRVQQAQAVAAWFPEINDNDLIINVTLDRNGRVVETRERFIAKSPNPVSIRGQDRLGRREYSADQGNKHVINQVFEMARLPTTNIAYRVETDR